MPAIQQIAVSSQSTPVLVILATNVFLWMVGERRPPARLSARGSSSTPSRTRKPALRSPASQSRNRHERRKGE
jgi:hypothetical protein